MVVLVLDKFLRLPLLLSWLLLRELDYSRIRYSHAEPKRQVTLLLTSAWSVVNTRKYRKDTPPEVRELGISWRSMTNSTV
jgi:hypothetical protein